MQDAERVKTGYVENNGTKLYYEMKGAGHPIVLIHGGYLDRRMWDEQFTVLAERYQVVRYDIRGFGRSDLPAVAYSDREDLYALLQALNIKQTYLLALSLGGIIAVEFTLEHPEMVDALILEGTPIPGYPLELACTPQQLQELKQRWTPFAQATREKNTASMVDFLMADPTLMPSPQYPVARQHVRQMLTEYSFAWVLNPAPKQELVPPAYERLTDIHIPTLLIVGSEDHFQLHDSADRLQQAIIGSKLIKIAETHHMPNIEKPEQFNQIVLDFLTTCRN